MAQRYVVDLRSLDPAKREAAYKQIDELAFMTEMVFGPAGLEAVEVFWTSEEDFTTSPLIPPGCRCTPC